MEIRQLRYFMAVAEMKSFSRASASAHIAQPALSRQVKKLEDELGVPLFHRDGRGVSLNTAGEQFYKRVSVLMQDLQQAKAEVQYSQTEPTGEVTLGVPQQLGASFIAGLFTSFQAQYRRANLRIVDGLNSQICEWLELGRVDVGIIYGSGRRHDVSAELVFMEDLFLVGPVGHPACTGQTCLFESLSALPLVMPDRPSSLLDQVEEVALQFDTNINVVIKIDSIGAIKELVRDGRGLSIMPLAAVSQEVRRGELSVAKIVDPCVSRPLVIALSPKASLSLPSKKLIELLRREVEACVHDNRWSGTLSRGNRHAPSRRSVARVPALRQA